MLILTPLGVCVSSHAIYYDAKAIVCHLSSASLSHNVDLASLHQPDYSALRRRVLL